MWARRTVSFEKDSRMGPWANSSGYKSEKLEDRITDELTDLENWLKPSESEELSRLLTIRRFVNFIEEYFRPCIVVTQGSSATDTFLPTSDIDLIVTNLPDIQDEVRILKNITKLFWQHQLIVQGFVIPGAKVPIAKCIDRAYGYNIDICIGNANGSLNVPRVKNYLSHYPQIRPILMFLKALTYVTDTDNPATGGFGSNHLLNLVIFAIQAFPEAKSTGELLLKLMDCIANKFNYFMCGISIVNGGCLFSKPDTNNIDFQCPQAFVFEDPQMHNIFFGGRTHKMPLLVSNFKKALVHVNAVDPEHSSALTAILGDLHEISERRQAIDRVARFLNGSLKDFACEIDLMSKSAWTSKKIVPHHGIVRVGPDANRAQLTRSISNPEGFDSKNHAKKAWQRALEKRQMIKEIKKEVTHSRSIPDFKDFKKSSPFKKKFRK
ncbi:hypothetical protein TVAG_080950 [Trichomonas vaginalis G3]|uniref:Nucleotidyltransferase domain containing protein n=1 Tax=Trichomonas vaginalis (strain ATCC PRA-98 / G3) TaxID=412133 RepID=A2EPB8_TRIV3|nr:polynucleotide adenylyltransferase protein [Trichomonas vaginalis G3]EAY05503.1 hypothetical protein TVAG_080950 [Trichomonas vaginalis G3]KAI5507806.1 polynucleotide adenylyltransferase protein [Trichomonas vaginalis G3]|eukprot:XP_001317726.1 hypothetical protein [Trichomonas vaginalis G3]